MHFCESLKIDISTARTECPFCGIQIAQAAERPAQNGIKSSVPISTQPKEESQLALAEAEAKAREAEERFLLAEATARKEIALRVEAERRVEEIERKVTRELITPQNAAMEPDLARRETELARAKAEAEAKARREAEERAREVEERLLQAEAAARTEAEMRAAAEMKAREMADNLSNARGSKPTPRKDKVMIALYASLAGVLFILLILLLGTMIRIAGY
jgi:hypothetical protein